MKAQGVHNYSIHYLASTSQLFAYAETDSLDSFEGVKATDDLEKWWKYFEDAHLMRYNEDAGATKLGGATPWADGLKEVFYME